MKTTAIAALKLDQPAKITGVVSPRAELLTSPISGHPCIGFKVVIEERDSGGTWRTVFKTAACAAFTVTDETGTAVVEGPVVIGLDPADGAWKTCRGACSSRPRKS